MTILERRYDKICIWICQAMVYKNDINDDNNGADDND